MSLKDDIVAAQIAAMKAKDSETLSILRMTTSAIKNEEINAGGDLTDEQVQAVVSRQVKQLKDALADFESGDRAELVEKTKQEIEVLAAYLPAQLSEDEIRSRVAEILGGQTDMQMGQAIGMVMKELKGQADGNLVRQIVTETLQQ